MIDTLAKVLPCFENEPVCVIGTLNLALQGIDVLPHDVDLLTTDTGIAKFAAVYGGTVDDSRGFKEVWQTVGNHEVNVTSAVGNHLRPDDFAEHIKLVSKDSQQIPCLALKQELAFYKAANRPKDQLKISLIEAALSQELGE